MDRSSLPQVRLPERSGNATTDLVLTRIGITPPYYALHDAVLEGERFEATAYAEAPAFLEQGPMTAAEIGRHSAIAGQSVAAMGQRDDQRRYFLARKAECFYLPTEARYGAPVRLRAVVTSSEKRQAAARISVTSGGQPLAEVEVTYTILTKVTFERLFRRKRIPTHPVPSPYGALISEVFESGNDSLEQRLEIAPGHCVGHFDDYPALPVAAVMGQLSYLAGQLMATPFRVTRGSVRASDLCWAGETVRFFVRRLESVGAIHHILCVAETGEDREVGRMDLWLERLPTNAIVN